MCALPDHYNLCKRNVIFSFFTVHRLITYLPLIVCTFSAFLLITYQPLNAIPHRLPGKREVAESFFIEPLTAVDHSLTSPRYLGIESMWNRSNYWVNMQDCSDGVLVRGVTYVQGRNFLLRDYLHQQFNLNNSQQMIYNLRVIGPISSCDLCYLNPPRICNMTSATVLAGSICCLRTTNRSYSCQGESREPTKTWATMTR